MGGVWPDAIGERLVGRGKMLKDRYVIKFDEFGACFTSEAFLVFLIVHLVIK